MESRHLVSSLSSDGLHHLESILVSGGEVEEGESVEVLGLLVSDLDDLKPTKEAREESTLPKEDSKKERELRTNLVASLLQSLSSESSPNVLLLDSSSHLQRNVQVSALDGEIEPRARVLNEVKSDLGVTLLLEVGDDALSDEVGVSNDLQDLVVVLLRESELESVLGRIDVDGSRSSVSVDAVNNLSLDSSEVDGLVESLDDSGVAGGERKSTRRTESARAWEDVRAVTGDELTQKEERI